MHFHILMYNLNYCGMKVVDSGTKAHYMVQYLLEQFLNMAYSKENVLQKR